MVSDSGSIRVVSLIRDLLKYILNHGHLPCVVDRRWLTANKLRLLCHFDLLWQISLDYGLGGQVNLGLFREYFFWIDVEVVTTLVIHCHVLRERLL